jgi:hypothetical protein
LVELEADRVRSCAMVAGGLALSLLFVSAFSLIRLLSVPKNERIEALPVSYTLLQIVGVSLTAMAFGLWRQAGPFVVSTSILISLVDLLLGYRIVVVLGLVGGVLIGRSITSNSFKYVLIAVVPLAILGFVIKPVYYRIAAGQIPSPGEIPTYFWEGLATYEGTVIASTSQVVLDDRELYALEPVTALTPSLLPLGNSVFGEPTSYAEAVRDVSFPDTPWGFGGSFVVELVIRNGPYGLLLGMTAVVVMTRLRTRNQPIFLAYLCSAPWAFFYLWRSDLSVVIDSGAKTFLMMLVVSWICSARLFTNSRLEFWRFARAARRTHTP